MQFSRAGRQHQGVESRAVMVQAQRQRIATHAALNLRSKGLAVNGAANARPAQVPGAAYFIALTARLYFTRA